MDRPRLKRFVSRLVLAGTAAGSVLGLVEVALRGPGPPGDLGRRTRARYEDGPALLGLGRDCEDGTPTPRRGEPDYLRVTIPHPYLGFVNDRRGPVAEFLGTPREDLVPRPGRRRVALLGGSFAMGLGWSGRAGLARGLGIPVDDLVLVNVAQSGHKQPQQVMALAYLLSQGARFDLVLNVDGFNEVVLPLTDLRPFGIHPAFPRDWRFRAPPPGGPGGADTQDALWEARTDRINWLLRFRNWGIGASRLGALLWDAGDRVLARRVMARSAELSREELARKDYVYAGPAPPPNDPVEASVDLWERSSHLLRSLCLSEGIGYHHVLQPNQYAVRPASDFGPRGNRIHREDHPYRDAAREGYRRLILRGARLAAAGIPLHDGTRVFADAAVAPYVDDCCHLTPEGYEEFGAWVGRRVAASGPSHSTPPGSEGL